METRHRPQVARAESRIHPDLVQTAKVKEVPVEGWILPDNQMKPLQDKTAGIARNIDGLLR